MKKGRSKGLYSRPFGGSRDKLHAERVQLESAEAGDENAFESPWSASGLRRLGARNISHHGFRSSRQNPWVVAERNGRNYPRERLVVCRQVLHAGNTDPNTVPTAAFCDSRVYHLYGPALRRFHL